MAYTCAPPTNQELSDLIDSKFREFREGSIVKGTILEIRPQVVLVDTSSGTNVDPNNPVNPLTPDANTTATVAITAITDDTGVSSTDFVTKDNTLTYSGTVAGFTANTDKVKLELLGADGSTVITTA